jgi:hypothetical protein
MKRLTIVFLLIITLTGCGVFDRGNYEKDRSGYVINDNLIAKYHTNSTGEIDIFVIDQLYTYFEALELIDFDASLLSSDAVVSSYVTTEELTTCGISADIVIPRFIRVGNLTYFYNIKENNTCTYDQYAFYPLGVEPLEEVETSAIIPIEPLNVMRFNEADFTINPFENIVYIEEIAFNNVTEVWEKTMVTALPMSLTQAGNIYEENQDTIAQITHIQNYLLSNQSINLLSLVEDYEDEDVNMIWTDETIDYVGRDSEVVKNVRLKYTQDILDLINDTLSRLGMF